MSINTIFLVWFLVFSLELLQYFIFSIIVLSSFHFFRRTFNFLLFSWNYDDIYPIIPFTTHFDLGLFSRTFFEPPSHACFTWIFFYQIALDCPLHRPATDRAFPTFSPYKCPYHALLVFRFITDQMVHLISKCPSIKSRTSANFSFAWFIMDREVYFSTIRNVHKMLETKYSCSFPVHSRKDIKATKGTDRNEMLAISLGIRLSLLYYACHKLSNHLPFSVPNSD